MAAIPLIQPSSSAARFGASTTKRSIFSTPTVDLHDRITEQDLLNEQDNEEDYVSTMYLIPSPIGKDISVQSWTRNNRTIEAVFRPSTNEIAVFVAGKKAAEEFPIRQHSSAKDNTVFLCQASIPESRIPFIKEMSDAFLNTTTLDPYGSEDYRHHYEQYYKGIQRYLLQLYQSKNDMETEEAVQDAQELELMEAFSAIWRLAEYMFLTADDSKPIAFLYSEWLSVHDTGLDLEVGKLLLASSGRLSDSRFWPYIHQCLLRGMRESVVFMIEQTLNDEPDEDVADALDGFLRILKGIPSPETILLDGKSYERHRKWQEDCKKFAKSPQLSHLGVDAKKAVSILTGDIEAILDSTESWEEAFSAILLYTNPNCSRQDLTPILKICISRYMEDTKVSLFDKIKIAILEIDAIKTIRHCGNFHPWLVAHLADVLQQYGYLDISDLELQDIADLGWDSDVRDFFITSYAQSLMSNLDLWEVIAGYLLNCGHTGKAMLSEWICHVPLGSSEKAHRVLQFCENNSLTDSLRSIYRVMAVDEETRGQYALAIQHFISSKDNDRVAKVTDSLMLDYLQSDELDLEEVLAPIPQLPANDYVDFLRSYAKFHRDYKNGDYRSAGRTLVQLLSGKAPKKYWAMLLFNALPLLENKERLVFDSKDTYAMLRCLEEVVGPQHKAEYLHPLPKSVSSAVSTVEEREEQLGVVRLSLVRNLARSFVHASRVTDGDDAMMTD
ncbi:Nup85 nucleoporin-domain-containing protein [Gamsiella multidivaricata]|uniref:Nup85 nucleoporin-domain-containing protein n=1 Tax=Gamsiella multidivaricata TaxID=101098 RepID=UPI00221E80DA|nr:Nup85 nucleoporin-domain-containing protein [Gamsiella multidivaricata]KAI7818859.1 Nup85 nucleoporin-domain-containing protein [Gamsiella multidivaricata]